MPSGKSKEDTWTEKELASFIQNRDDKKHRSSKDKSREKSGTKEESLKLKGSREKLSTSKSLLNKENGAISKPRKSDGKTEELSKRMHEQRAHEKLEPSDKTHDRSDRKKSDVRNSEASEQSHSKKASEKEGKKHRGEKHSSESKSRSKSDSKDKESKSEQRKMEDDKHKTQKKEHQSSKNQIDGTKFNENDDRHKRNKDDRKNSDKTILEKTKHKDTEKKLVEIPVENHEEADDFNYDDEEFDEYDDNDFEEDFSDDEENNESFDENLHDSANKHTEKGINADQIGVNEISKAIIAENERTQKIKHSIIREADPIPSEVVGVKKGKMNFVAANQKQMNNKKAEKIKHRSEVLLKLVQLDVREFDLFEMASLTEYELYMKKFGQSDAKQIFTQTNDDNVTQELQTDDIDTETRWCQHSHDLKACGIEGGDVKLLQLDAMTSMISNDSVRLNKFLIKASKVCISLLEELEAGIELPQLKYTEIRTPYSDGYVTLSSSDFLVLGRNFCDISYSPTQTNLMLTAYGPSNVVKKGLKSPKGLLCVWNSNEPNKAYMLLTCESKPNACCFSTGMANLAFAGMEDGVLAVWDLREPDSYHNTVLVGNTPQVFRNATFTTAASSDVNCFPVVNVMPLVSHASSKAASNGEGGDISFQLASLDETGSVSIWIVVEVENSFYDLSNVNEDLGLSPKGKVKLVKTCVIESHKSNSPFENLFLVTCMEVDPSNPNHIYTGTEQGEVLHLSRFGKRPIPKQLGHKEDSSVRVNAIDISPWRIPYLLVCYENGSIRLFNTKHEKSILSWSAFNNGDEIIDVQWSRSKPSVFFAMDINSVLYIWDLLQNDSFPILQQQLKRKDKRAIGFSFANDYSAIGIGTLDRAPEMAVVYGDGSIEVHRLSKQLSSMAPDDFDKTEEFLAQITTCITLNADVPQICSTNQAEELRALLNHLGLEIYNYQKSKQFDIDSETPIVNIETADK